MMSGLFIAACEQGVHQLSHGLSQQGEGYIWLLGTLTSTFIIVYFASVSQSHKTACQSAAEVKLHNLKLLQN